MSNVVQAHQASLPLFSTLLQLKEVEPEEACPVLKQTIDDLSLSKDIQVALFFAEDEYCLGFEPLTSFGQLVLNELLGRAETLPCPDGQCEYDGNECLWCGRARLLN